MKLQAFLATLFLMSSQSSFALYGKVAKTKDFGFVGSLILSDEEFPETKDFCNGVLIAPKIVLTAAHCVEFIGRDKYEDVYFLNQSPHLLKVRFGKQNYGVRSIKYAASYFELDGEASEDLAIIELNHVVKDITPVKRYAGNFKVGQSMTMVARQFQVNTTLKSAQRFRSSGAVVIKTQGAQAGTCAGDSGGALLTKVNNEWNLAGILMYDGENFCDKKDSISYGPNGHF